MDIIKDKLAHCCCSIKGRLDGGLSWLVVVSSFLLQFTVMGTHNVFGLFYTDLLKEFKKDRATTAWVASLSFGVTFLFGPIVTLFSAKHGIRIVTLTGAILFPLGLLATSFCRSLALMYITYSLLVGVGGCFCYYTSILILNEYFYERLVTTNGITLSGAGVGTFALAPVVESLLQIMSWRGTLRILSIISLVQILCFCVQVFIRPSTPPPVECQPGNATFKKKSLVDLSLFKSKAFVVWVLVVSLVLFGFYIPYVHLVRHCQDLNIPAKQGAMLVGYLAISQTIGKIFFGRVSDHPRVNRVYLFQYCLMVCGLSTTFLPLMTTIEFLTAYCWIFGFHDGCFVVLTAILAGDITGKEKMSSALSLTYMIASIPMVLGPPVAGWMYSSSNTYIPAFFMAGGFTIFGVCLLFLIPLLLPPEISREWKNRSSRVEVKLRSQPIVTISSDLADDKNMDSSSTPLSITPIEDTTQNLSLTSDNRSNSFSFLYGKNLSVPHLVNQRDSLLCRVYSRENLYGIFSPCPSSFERETDV